MNQTTNAKIIQIIDKTHKELTEGQSLEANTRGLIVDLFILVLERIDEVEKNIIGRA